MLPTWFLSMWISNTATTAMMIPIANAVLMQLKQARSSDDTEETGITIWHDLKLISLSCINFFQMLKGMI